MPLFNYRLGVLRSPARRQGPRVRRTVDPRVILTTLPCIQNCVCARGAGAKKREDIYAAFESIYPVLQEFRKGDVDPTLRPPPVPAQLPPPVRMGQHPAVALLSSWE